MKKLILLLAILPSGLSAQSLSGIIRDSLTRQPVVNASVRIEHSFIGTYSRSDGTFTISPGPRQTEAILLVSHIGYTTKRISVAGTESNIEVLLGPRSYPADEVVVTATRAGSHTGIAFSELSADQIAKINQGKDLPYLLEMQPSAVATSDAGNGVGYTGIRIRGTDPSRINVTINGIPVNDAESQLVFWVDIPDLAASAASIQVQRGAGTSTNGAGAFGGSINIQTHQLNEHPYASWYSSYGSFSTRKNSLTFGTGLLDRRFTFDARLSAIQSDGYIDRSSSDLKSIFVSHGFYGRNTSARLNIFSGKERTYQSWYGAPESRIKNDIQGMNDYVVRNGLDSEDSLNLLSSGRTYNYYTYKNQVDDYRQDNYQFHLAHQFSSRIYATAAVHYTKGKGFYEEYKKDHSLTDYGLSDSLIQSVFSSVNLIRRKWLDNDFYGATWSVHAAISNPLQLIFGGAWNQYNGDHFDELLWATYLPVQSIPHRYDFNNGFKTDFNSFIKAVWSKNQWTFYGDIQYRRVNYSFDMPVPEGYVRDNDITEFINPKAGISFNVDDRNRVYASVSTAGKEPSRKDYLDNPQGKRPVAEKMTDLEAGYVFQSKQWMARINLYHMKYDNQLALNGSINDVGEPVRINVKDSYRQGFETEISWAPVKAIRLSANAAISRNRIKSYIEVIPDYDDYSNDSLFFSNTPLSFSPDVIAAASADFVPVKNLTAGIAFKFTGAQYLDNTGSNDRKLNAYHFIDLRTEYRFDISKKESLSAGFTLHNLTNRLYESNGYTYSYIYNSQRITENFYYPQAGRHFMLHVSVKF